MTGNIKEGLSRVKAFVFDVDGVFSPDTVMLHPSGDMMRTMNIKDGYAVQYLVKQGYPVCIITGGASETVKQRFCKLGVTDIYLKAHNKMECFEDFIYKYDLASEEILYMGDDIPDSEVMKIVGFPTCPADAAEEIKEIVKYISDKKGGNGCVRDVIEQVLRLQGKWMQNEAFNW
jgi:3-deoxy-D-manno-octulosonate 8-phosphate phosphatase (KDO 8-P phosphatase)